MSDKQITGSEALMRALIGEGVDTIFGYPGGQAVNLYDSLHNYSGSLHHILVRHEQGAVHAAQGYARVSGRTGVVMVTSGPGATNTITGIADAMLDSTPIVIITGQVGSPLLGTDAFQETDMVGITQPITKWAHQIRSACDVAWATAQAFYIASTGRPGPVVLDFTKDAQIALTEFVPHRVTHIRSYKPVPPVDKDAVSRAAQMINRAERPLALIGQGVILANAEEELLAFLRRADIPAASTIMGLSAIPSADPLNAGMLGMHGNVAPNLKTNECDVLIAIGMRFADRVTGNLQTYARQAQVIHFDIDPSEIDKNVKTALAVLGDAKQTLPAVTRLLTPATHTEWRESFRPLLEKEMNRVIRTEVYPEEGAIKMGEVIHRVSEMTASDAVMVTDVGQNQMMAVRYFRHRRTRSVVTSGGLGTMGFGLPAAIGAKLGAPDRTVCLFVGDGGLQMTVQELGTIMQWHVNVKIILMNNSYLGMVRQWQQLFFKERYSGTPMENPDFVMIAAAYGIPGKKVTERADLDAAIAGMLATDGAYLLEVTVEQKGIVYPMIPAGACITDMLLGNSADADA